MTYMVMEVHTSYCIVMDEAGRFIKAANMNFEIGQTIERIEALVRPRPKRKNITRVITITSSIAACLVIALAFSLTLFTPPSSLTPYAAVYLSINPEVRLDVTKDGQVSGATGLNEDAKTLLNGYDASEKELKVVTSELMKRSVELGFLSDGGSVTVSIDAPDEAWFESTGIDLRKNLSGMLGKDVTVSIEIKRFEQASKDDQARNSNTANSSNDGDVTKTQPPPNGLSQGQPTNPPRNNNSTNTGGGTGTSATHDDDDDDDSEDDGDSDDDGDDSDSDDDDDD